MMEYGENWDGKVRACPAQEPLGRFRVDGQEITGRELCRVFGYTENPIMVGLCLGHIKSNYGKVEVIT